MHTLYSLQCSILASWSPKKTTVFSVPQIIILIYVYALTDSVHKHTNNIFLHMTFSMKYTYNIKQRLAKNVAHIQKKLLQGPKSIIFAHKIIFKFTIICVLFCRTVETCYPLRLKGMAVIHWMITSCVRLVMLNGSMHSQLSWLQNSKQTTTVQILYNMLVEWKYE